MANPNPNTEHLSLGRGKRPKLNHQTVSMRMSRQTRENLECIAEGYDCLYGGRPWIAGLLEKIGSGELVVVPAPPVVPESVKVIDSKKSVREYLAKKDRSGESERSTHLPQNARHASSHYDVSGHAPGSGT